MSGLDSISKSLDSVSDWVQSVFRSATGSSPEPKGYDKLHATNTYDETCAIEGTGFYHCTGSVNGGKKVEVPFNISPGVTRN